MTYIPILVLRDVLRPERGDAQADGDRQAAQRNHCPAPALPLTRGIVEINFFLRNNDQGLIHGSFPYLRRATRSTTP